MNTIKKVKTNKKFYELLTFSLLYFSSDTLLFGTNYSANIKLVGYMYPIVFFLGFTFFALYKNIKFSKDSLYLLFAFIFLSVLTIITTFDISIKYFYVMLLCGIAFLFAGIIGIDEFKESYLNVLYVLALFSLISTILYYVAYPMIIRFPIIVNESDYKFYFLLLSVIPQKKLYVSYRNYGIFREPGVFSVFLIVAILLELSQKTPRKGRFIVYIITLITTFSTAGYLVLSFVFVGYMMSLKGKKQLKVLFCSVFILVLFYTYQSGLLQEQLKKLTTENASLEARLGAFVVNIKMVFNNLGRAFFGNGFSYVERNYSILANSLGILSTHNTNTLLKMVSVYGLVFIILIIKNLIVFFQNCPSKLWGAISFLAFCIILCNEDLIVNIFIYLLCFYAKTEKRKNRNIMWVSYASCRN